jgi:hypothetical protein
MPQRTELWLWIERRLDGRSWNWLGGEVGVTGSTARAWASGRTPIKGYQADAIADALEASRDELRAIAGLEPSPVRVTTGDEERDRLLSELGATTAHGGLERLATEQLREVVEILRSATNGDPVSR